MCQNIECSGVTVKHSGLGMLKQSTVGSNTVWGTFEETSSYGRRHFKQSRWMLLRSCLIEVLESFLTVVPTGGHASAHAWMNEWWLGQQSFSILRSISHLISDVRHCVFTTVITCSWAPFRASKFKAGEPPFSPVGEGVHASACKDRRKLALHPKLPWKSWAKPAVRFLVDLRQPNLNQSTASTKVFGCHAQLK